MRYTPAMTETTAVRVPAGARWDCHSCGACCRLYELGPVDPHIIDGLKQKDIAAHWPPAAAQPWYEQRPGPDGSPAYFLTHRDGHCVFLRDDNLCAVHGLFGADAKPSFCREYPFHLVEDPKGLVAVVRSSCAGWHTTQGTGPTLDAHVAEVTALPRVVPLRTFSPEFVAVAPEVHVPLATWMEWEARLVEVANLNHATPELAFQTVKMKIAELTGLPFPAPNPERARLATGAVVEALRRVMAKVVADTRPDEDPHRVEFATKMAQDLATALPALRQPPPPFSAAAREHQLVLLRTFLLAKSWHAIGSVAEGLGAFAVQRAVIQALASPGENGEISAAAAGAVLVRWTKLIENRAILGVLKIVRPALLDVFLYS